jgi:hypothetical protein
VSERNRLPNRQSFARPRDRERVLDLVQVERKSGEERKHRNAARFMWHEQLIKRPYLTLTSVRLAGLIMHSRSLATKGYVALSLKDAAADLSVTKQAVINARDLLVADG